MSHGRVLDIVLRCRRYDEVCYVSNDLPEFRLCRRHTIRAYIEFHLRLQRSMLLLRELIAFQNHVGCDFHKLPFDILQKWR